MLAAALDLNILSGQLAFARLFTDIYAAIPCHKDDFAACLRHMTLASLREKKRFVYKFRSSDFKY